MPAIASHPATAAGGTCLITIDRFLGSRPLRSRAGGSCELAKSGRERTRSAENGTGATQKLRWVTSTPTRQPDACTEDLVTRKDRVDVDDVSREVTSQAGRLGRDPSTAPTKPMVASATKRCDEHRTRRPGNRVEHGVRALRLTHRAAVSCDDVRAPGPPSTLDESLNCRPGSRGPGGYGWRHHRISNLPLPSGASSTCSIADNREDRPAASRPRAMPCPRNVVLP